MTKSPRKNVPDVGIELGGGGGGGSLACQADLLPIELPRPVKQLWVLGYLRVPSEDRSDCADVQADLCLQYM